MTALNYFRRSKLIAPTVTGILQEETIKEHLGRFLRALQLELRTPPRPDAVCKLPGCTEVQQGAHICPSENIFLSDPDYRGFFRVYCRDNCIMDYHRACWLHLKESRIASFKLTKLPTERDFFGKECFTPDCGGLIYKIEIHEQDGNLNCLGGDKTLEEERDRKKECKQRREVENKSKSKTDVKKVKKNKYGLKNNSGGLENSEAAHGEVPGGKVHAAGQTDNKENTVANYEDVEPIDYSAIDVSNAVVIKKNRGGHEEEDGEDNKKRKRAANKKAVLSLNEFIGNQGVEVGNVLK
jgi:hypothetical protein